MVKEIQCCLLPCKQQVCPQTIHQLLLSQKKKNIVQKACIDQSFETMKDLAHFW